MKMGSFLTHYEVITNYRVHKSNDIKSKEFFIVLQFSLNKMSGSIGEVFQLADACIS